MGATPAELLGLTSSVRRMFDLTADPAKIGAVLRGDPTLRALVDARPGLRIPGAWDPFECGVRAILGQQISIAAPVGLLAHLVMIAGEPLAQVGSKFTHLFPTPAAIADTNLDDLDVPVARREALRAFATAVAHGRIDFSVTHEQLMRALMQVSGIGKWRADYIALRGLGELDALPHGDVLLCRQASLQRKPLAPKALEVRAEAWRPFRSYAALHLWAASTPHELRSHSFKVRRQPVHVGPAVVKSFPG
jgi:3-methyladenine DNA glycosylase/8-oxoguanine DNA glycosylase